MDSVTIKFVYDKVMLGVEITINFENGVEVENLKIVKNKVEKDLKNQWQSLKEYYEIPDFKKFDFVIDD